MLQLLHPIWPTTDVVLMVVPSRMAMMIALICLPIKANVRHTIIIYTVLRVVKGGRIVKGTNRPAPFLAEDYAYWPWLESLTVAKNYITVTGLSLETSFLRTAFAFMGENILA